MKERTGLKGRRMARMFTVALSVIIVTGLCSCAGTMQAVVQAASAASAASVSTAKPVTGAQAADGMRQALRAGIEAAAGKLSAADGYFGDEAVKILMPEEAKPMIDMVGKIPQGKRLEDDVVLRLNRSAEEAAKEVIPIFADAITSMTIEDAIAILKGGDRSATGYLASKTRDRLFSLYRPKVDAALAKPLVMDVSAKKSWEALSASYNQTGAVVNRAARATGKNEPMPPVSVDLASYATNRALDGLFRKIGDEEGRIRENPLAYASSAIRTVFGALKDGTL